ncbi:hypothetical protein MKW98_010843 [Papaver atlanticum]|uniref:glycerophosphodiester phosphodiesterase n=1 Tax=Papaver atlanticum TaxID=357466 RepID=A0AAD4XHC2_9MAGN|nr:hypothetical protein MKW98_010843 [Papaver atlanticum]
MAALKSLLHVSNVPNLDQVPKTTTLSSSIYSKGIHSCCIKASSSSSKLLVLGHRGSGMNMNSSSSDERMKSIKENSILSFNKAADYAVDYVEFDVQVTKDNVPVIFHDDEIITGEENDGAYVVSERKVTEITLAEFLSYGPQRESVNMSKCYKPLLRKSKDGRICKWNVENDDSLCTLQEAFQNVNSSLGFNIELKFDDYFVYRDDEIVDRLRDILRVVLGYAKERPVIFSTFQPDAARLVRKLQNRYPVYFLTEGGTEIYTDVRRNSLDEAIKLCLENGLQGIVSDVRGLLRNQEAVSRIKEARLSLLTYGELNNVREAVYVQYLMGVEGVIVDFVGEISETVSDLIKPVKEEEERISFTQCEFSFLQNLVSELTQL